MIKKHENSLETIKKVLSCSIISILLYCTEYWTVSSQIKGKRGKSDVDLETNAENTVDRTCV